MRIAAPDGQEDVEERVVSGLRRTLLHHAFARAKSCSQQRENFE
jgi:hypothetical protein